MTPLVFDIKRSSLSDGPGIRTAVFLKGCSLDCFWCHNPEGKSPLPETGFFSEKCSGCGTCAGVCPGGEKCVSCGRCAGCCPNGARKLWGRTYGAKELFDVICADRDYYAATGGGVTFSGGECLLYPDFVAEVSGMCRKEGISVAVDTAGYVPWSSFEKVLPYADIFLYDIKALDPELHRRGTGADNTLILENLSRLAEAGRRIIIRTPVIPGFNAGEETDRISAFCAKMGFKHEMLPYHSFGESKKAALRLGKTPAASMFGKSASSFV